MNLPKKVIPFVFYFARQQWIGFSIAIIASIAWGLNNALFPYFLKRLINALSSSNAPAPGMEHAVRNALLLMLFSWISVEILMRAQGFLLSTHCLAEFRASIRKALFEYVQTHSSTFFANNFSGTIASKISDVPINCETMIITICFEFLMTFIGAIATIITMWIGHPLFAEILISWLAVHLLLMFFFLRKGNSFLEEHANSVTALTGKIVDVFTNIQNVKLFAREKYEHCYLQHFQNEEIKKSHKAYTHLEWMYVGFGINGICLICGMLFFLMKGWQHHWVSLGDFTQIMMQTCWLSGWMWFVSYQGRVFVRTAATVRSALSLIHQPHEILDTPAAAPLTVPHGAIHFDHVDFSYPGNHAVFKDLNVTISPGEKVGLVGLSGAGKSTFMNLLLRLYDVQAGKICIDGQVISEVTQESLHENIAVIPQDSSLFHRTLMENIRYGRLEATEEEVITASKQAHCHEFIEQLDYGYEALVGERGVKLSGGQRQRIAIARALLKNAPILILDEATSSLDSATEKKIQTGLNILMENRTTIVIAHRLSTLAAMDRILVFYEGKIVEDGTIQELLQQQSHFAMLWKMQQEGMIL